MGYPLGKIALQGFKSIKILEDFELNNLNVLIGANGAGKSNFVDFFRMLRAMIDEKFQMYVNDRGGDGLFFLGPKQTNKIKAGLEFGENVYRFELAPTTSGIQITDESVQFTGGLGIGSPTSIGSGLLESNLKKKKDEEAHFGRGKGVPHYVYQSVSDWIVYHFHDTSSLAPMRREQPVQDNDYFRPDASNIAAYLFKLKEDDDPEYESIVDTVRLVTPFFDTFKLEPKGKEGEERIALEWLQKNSDFPFRCSHLSDGSLRFICLATALLQPFLPSTIIIDEPELGLHPYAIEILAELVKAASKKTQIIISTQSPALVDCFEPEDIIVVTRENGESIFKRLVQDELSSWLDEYSLGDLWRKNIMAGGPVYE